jgi:hypothetical protein
MTMTTPADLATTRLACITDLVVVVPAPELSAAVDDVLSGTTITALGSSDDLESDCIQSATSDHPIGAYRPALRDPPPANHPWSTPSPKQRATAPPSRR